MKKLFVICMVVVVLLVFVGCSTNKVQEPDPNVRRYEQREIERKVDKAFNELDKEIEKIKEEEKGEKK